MVKLLIDPIGDGAIGEQGGETAFARVQQCEVPLHIQVALLLPGKTGVRQIFGGGAAAHRDINRRAAAESFVGLHDGPFQVGRHFRR